MWSDWTNVILGFAIVVIAFLDLSHGTLTWTLVFTGFLIAAFGLWGAGVTHKDV